MKTFPMFLKMTARRVVIVGGGEQAAQKARLILKTEAEIVLLAPDLEPELADLVRSGRARQSHDPSDLDGAVLVFVATGCKGADGAWHTLAKQAGAVVNVVDYPELCDAMTPSIVDRDPVVVAIGTEGTAPVLGRRLKTRIEELLHPRLGAYAALAGRLRAEVAHRIAARARRDFWAWVFTGAPWRAFSSGQERAATREIKEALQTGHRHQSGHLCVVLGAGDPGLMPMAAIQRMQEADAIYYDRNVPDAVLELARRDAERIALSRPGLASAAPFEPSGLLLRAAQNGSVVYVTQDATAPILQRPTDTLLIETLACGQRVPMASQRPSAAPYVLAEA